MTVHKMAIIGGGNLGKAIARGLVAYGDMTAETIWITRRSEKALEQLQAEGFATTTDNAEAIEGSSLIVIAVRPKQMDAVLDEIAPHLDPNSQILVSTASDVRIENIQRHVGPLIPIIRAMPNIGVAVGESMTCLSCHHAIPAAAKKRVSEVFEHLGIVAFIEEEQMSPATALCACGVAFFLRAIRAASQGGVQVGFHADEAIRLAAQTAKGAAELVLASGQHPESLIDTVTTPLGITIAGLNEMEHYGFASAMIRGIVVSAERAGGLYQPENSSKRLD
ncbi:pyrroline-5-carboxylate reductase [Candidatus Bipolaricaulota bacterium]|nr:pyrroline-5-carboxylate reductase [Candidatus Bipolaricaulota bacterium]